MRSSRKGILFGFTTAAGVVAAASLASACVTFMGHLEVQGHDGNTEVAGTGNSHGYCSTGRPQTAAAGHLEDLIRVEVKPTVCNDVGSAGANQLPDGTYEVRYRNFKSYSYDGTYWNMDGGTGCFRNTAFNQATSSIIGTFQVVNGRGEWAGTLGAAAVKGGQPVFSADNEANNFCVGAPSLPPVTPPGIIPGNLAPYRLLAI